MARDDAEPASGAEFMAKCRTLARADGISSSARTGVV